MGVKYGSVLSGLKQELLWLFAGFSGETTALASALESCGPGDCHQAWPCHRRLQGKAYVFSGGQEEVSVLVGVPYTYPLPREPAPDRGAGGTGLQGAWVQLCTLVQDRVLHPRTPGKKGRAGEMPFSKVVLPFILWK